jgi:ParB-like chromosome segregation protein Spo0J
MPRTKVVVKKEDAVGLVEMRRVKLSKLKDAPYNPRTISDEAMVRLERSVEVHGMVIPIVWNERTGNVVGGHQRKKVLEKIGAKEVDVVVVNVPLEQEKVMNVALNNQFISGDWDLEKLHSLITEAGNGFEELAQLPDFFVREMDRLFRAQEEIMSSNLSTSEEFKVLGIDEDKEREHAVICPKCGHVFAG